MSGIYKIRNIRSTQSEYLDEKQLLKAYPELDDYLLSLDKLVNIKVFQDNATFIIER